MNCSNLSCWQCRLRCLKFKAFFWWTYEVLEPNVFAPASQCERSKWTSESYQGGGFIHVSLRGHKCSIWGFNCSGFKKLSSCLRQILLPCQPSHHLGWRFVALLMMMAMMMVAVVVMIARATTTMTMRMGRRRRLSWPSGRALGRAAAGRLCPERRAGGQGVRRTKRQALT